MDYIRFAISNPVKVAVGVMLILLFGLIALFTIPIQLTPNVDQPVINVSTTWVGRSPEEVEREIIEKQEDKLKGVSNLKKMVATAYTGQAEIELEFYVGADMDRALREVSNKLREVPSYPDGVDEPVIVSAEAGAQTAVAWMILSSTDPDFEVDTLKDQAEKRIKPYLERIEGVARVDVYGGREREVHIQIDPRRLAERGITFNQLSRALRLENVNISAGDIAEGRLDVRVRTVGQYDNLEDIRQTIVTYADGGPVRIRDLGEVVLTYEKQRAFVRSKGQVALAMPVFRETGSNVITVLGQLHERVKQVNRDILPTIVPAGGPPVSLDIVYDETVYIYDALRLVLNNLWLGGTMAIIVLILFLRKIRPTVVVAMAIPISVIGTFVAMTAAGRNLNVISLAGLAFAVGMVVDAAIVVLENIDRHMGMGKPALRAAYEATTEVWGAILASTLTTLAVFIPVLFIQEEAGQLFRDISLAICAAVSLSLLVSVTVIPSASARFLVHREEKAGLKQAMQNLLGLAKPLAIVRDAYASAIYLLTAPRLPARIARVSIIAAFVVTAVGGSYWLMPPTTYLPSGNRNLVVGFMTTPPAYNLQQMKSVGDRIEYVIRPYWEARSYADTAQLPPVLHPFTGQPIERIPPIDNFFFVSFFRGTFMGAASMDKQNVEPLGGLISSSSATVPGAMLFAFQVPLFGRGLGGTNSIEVEISGTDLNTIRSSAKALFMTLLQHPNYGFGRVQPDPMNFDLAGPEVQVQIDRVRAAELGIDVAALGLGVQALVDGAVIGDYRLEGESIDIVMTRPPDYPLTSDTLGQVPLAYVDAQGNRGTTPLAAVAHMIDTEAPQQIKRIEQLRAIKLTVLPKPEVPLQSATEEIAGIIQNLRAQGQISRDVEAMPAGTASKLVEVREAMLGQWYGFSLASLKSLLFSRVFLALLITYLLMAALFESFLYPFVILFTVPLATVGGFLGLRITHTFDPTQQLDVVTMLGFVILIGIVVNNAILIVHQSLNFMRGFGESQNDRIARMPIREAIRESVRSRLRPVFMTTLTSVCGMAPLVLMPGSGSELYKGLGSVIIGGLTCSTIFTLVVVPLVFSLVLDVKAGLYRLMRWPLPPDLAEGQPQVASTPAASAAVPKTA